MNHSPTMPSRHDGFTILEMSIVLVIIGLIVGGVLVGKDMIRAAENRAFLSQISQYDTAVNVFQQKYNCLPGDCSNGTQLGFAANGNGNGIVTSLRNNHNLTWVDYGNSDPSARPFFDPAYEGGLFWSMLQTAKLVTSLTPWPGATVFPDFPLMKDSHEWLALAGWSGRHYYRTGYTDIISGIYGYPCRNSFSPSDVLYIATKIGQTTFTTTTTAGPGAPDAVLQGDRVIVVGSDPACPNDAGYYYPPTMGAGGASSDVCLNTNTSPPSLNVANTKKLCSLMMRAEFSP